MISFVFSILFRVASSGPVVASTAIVSAKSNDFFKFFHTFSCRLVWPRGGLHPRSLPKKLISCVFLLWGDRKDNCVVLCASVCFFFSTAYVTGGRVGMPSIHSAGVDNWPSPYPLPGHLDRLLPTPSGIQDPLLDPSSPQPCFHHFFQHVLYRLFIDFWPQLGTQNQPKLIKNKYQDPFNLHFVF